MAAAAPTPHAPSLVQHRRKSQVFVEIPPSPLFRSRVASAASSKVDDSSKSQKPESHKENAVPLSTKTSMNNLPTDANGKGKRKLQDEDSETNANPKKAKILKADNPTLVACHQCRTKKSPNIVLQCTSRLKVNSNRCKAAYCDTCLKNRYGERLETIVQRKPPQSREDHDPATDYHFTCPRCDGICNCAPCRKKQGLAPVGKFTSTKNGESVREILEKNPQASGRLPKTTVMPVPKPPKPAKTEGSSKAVAKAEKKKRETANPKERPTTTVAGLEKKKKLKVAPEPVWVPIPQAGTRQDMEDRIYLREFILRFNPILNIGLRNVDELDDFMSLHDQSTKAVLLALLDLIAVEDDVQKKLIQTKVKKIRGFGLNWTTIAPVLYELRDSLPGNHALRSMPDLNQSDVEVSYNTRGTRMQGVYADQLLPVLLYLVDVVAEGASVRSELDEGNRVAKDVRAAHFKALREETERWAAEKAELTEEKSTGEKEGDAKWNPDVWKVKYRKAESEHKAIVADIQHSSRPEVDGCLSRFMPLGKDIDGRTYYVLSACGPQRGKKERLPSEGERCSMKRWGWFVAVWGKPGTTIQQDTIDEDEDEEDLHAERWWGFADVEEIRKLSKWLTYRAEADMSGEKGSLKKSASADDTLRPETATASSSTLASRAPSPSRTAATISEPGTRPMSPLSDLSASDSEDGDDEMDVDDALGAETNMSQPATQAGVKALAKSVLEFADFIDWRLKRDERKASKTGSAIASEKFYAGIEVS